MTATLPPSRPSSTSTDPSRLAAFFRRHIAAAVWTVIGGLLFMGSAPLWFTALQNHVLPPWLGGHPGISAMSGGCASGWQVYAQNRWTPVGTAVRSRPSTDAKKIDSIAPNIPLTVDGWVHGQVAYADNPAPFNNDIWLHRESGGWVSYAGVRATPTYFDRTLRSPDGGIAASLPDTCEAEAH